MFRIVPRDEKFFDQIEQLASLISKSSNLINEIVEKFSAVNENFEQMNDVRQRASNGLQTSLQRLDEAFITPLDREDIFQLMSDLHDVVVNVADVAQRFRLYGLKEIIPISRLRRKRFEKLHRLWMASCTR
jgi:uncharacterized protein Yka (UPF0111/DUF47 family)